MKYCERCLEEYEDQEMGKLVEFGESLFCTPCRYAFKQKVKDFLITFINNQPERSKREDHESGCGALNIVETQ